MNTPNRRVLPDKDPCDGLIALFRWFTAVNWAVLGGFKFEKDGDECVKMKEAKTKMEFDNGKDNEPTNLHYRLLNRNMVEK